MTQNISNGYFSHIVNYCYKIAGHYAKTAEPTVEEIPPVIDTPIHRIATAIGSVLSKENEEIQIWRNNEAEYRADTPPLKATHLKATQWHLMSTWKTICLIEDLMVESQPLTSLLPGDKSVLKKYCTKVAKENGGFLQRIWSRIMHGLRGESWVSTAAKAEKLLARIKGADSDYWVGFEDLWNPGNSQQESGRSRIYSVTKENYCDLSKQKKGIGFINGIQNSFNYALGNSEYLAELGGANIKAVYNANHGVFADLVESWYGWWGHRTKPSNKVRKIWDDFFDKQPSNARFLMFCHSQGAIHVKHALERYPEERRKRIDIVAVAPGVYIHPSICGSVTSYNVAAYRDPIPQIDLKRTWSYFSHWMTRSAKVKFQSLIEDSAYQALKNSIVTLDCDPRGEYIDHSFRSLTYAPMIAKHLLEFVNKKI